MIQNLHTNLFRYVHRQMEQVDDWSRTQKEHYQILDACQHRDTKAAVRLLKRHIDDSATQLLRSV